MNTRPSVRFFALLAAVSLACVTSGHASDAEKRLRDEYLGKRLVIRGFYTGDRLHYDSSGNEIGSATNGDWISDGLVLVRDIHLSRHHLTVEAKRLLIVELDEKEFQLATEDQKDLPNLKIESDLKDDSQADATFAKIFLIGHDSLADFVANYWKPCVREAASGDGTGLRFSPDLLAIPGITAESHQIQNDAATEKAEFDCKTKFTHRKGEFARVIHQVAPQFSEAARAAKYEGTVTLKLVVDENGTPRYIRVTKPIGHGLDEEAMRAVKQWVFAPLEKEGNSAPTDIVVQVNFHMY